ncbi:TLC domain-containing protein [Stachybotrys elegans]|uniref:TLC domain-containing protein n=1 Tax=Stachybotrys elegans TaxID=80388 RepID=A0A8K0SZ71_9HYPO|nr:TLC domain-containing protein [Stachybotrys elegans]
MATPEPFPAFNSSVDAVFKNSDADATRRRRKSSTLGGDIRAGDTGAPALASSRASLSAGEPRTSSGLSTTKAGHKRASKKRRPQGFFARAGHIMVKHTYVLPAIILAFFGAGYLINPTESNPLHRFIFLSYKLPHEDLSKPVQYGKGLWDIAFVSFYTVVLSFTREFIMQEILKPIARWVGLPRGKQARFMEQAYTALYFGILGPTGIYVMYRTPIWFFNTRGMYENFPHYTHDALFKFYYLFQAAYWAQQAIVLVLGLEKPRKDFKELICHHIVSLALIALSYRFHFTYIGLPVYITHDISDFFLASSKVLNYLDHWSTGPYFFVFMCTWIYLRHYINLKIIWSLFTEFRTIGPFELDWDAGQFKCRLSQVITASLLSALQALNLFWLFFIVRIAYRFIVHRQADDDRSEDENEPEEEEDEDEDEEEEPVKEKPSNGSAAQGKHNLRSKSAKK